MKLVGQLDSEAFNSDDLGIAPLSAPDKYGNSRSLKSNAYVPTIVAGSPQNPAEGFAHEPVELLESHNVSCLLQLLKLANHEAASPGVRFYRE